MPDRYTFWVHSNADTRLMSRILRTSSVVRSRTGPYTGLVPTLLTRKSTGPNASMVFAIASSWWAGSCALPATYMTFSDPSCSAASARGSALRPVMQTRSPRSTSAWAIANPMPRLAPVTMAVRA